jgi:hypothetical protein
MRNRIVQWAVLTVAWGTFLGCAQAQRADSGSASGRDATAGSQSGSFAWRFIGLNALKDKKDLVVLQQVTGLKEFEGFRSNLNARVAATIAKPLAQKGGNEAELTKLLNPIAADLTAYPTIYEHERHGDSNVWALAIQLPADRAEVWKNNWASISKGVTVSRQGDWTLVGNGTTKSVLEKTKKSTDDVLQVSGDGSAIQKFLPMLKPSKTDLHVTVQGKALRTEGKLQFDQDLGMKLAKWEIPSHSICEPLIGFTAIQGVQGHLSHLSAFNDQTAPNQLFIWSQDQTPYSSYIAAKVDKPNTFGMDLFKNANLKGMTNLVGDFQFDTNNHALYLQGLPLVVPFVRPANSNDVGFVYAGFIPTAFGTNGLPAELANQITSRNDLVYYDWEIGGARIAQVLPVRQMIAIIQSKPVGNYDTAEFKWLKACEPVIGNNITEISKTGARELSLVRRSDVGLSSVELLALTEWVAGPPAEPAHHLRKAGGNPGVGAGSGAPTLPTTGPAKSPNSGNKPATPR